MLFMSRKHVIAQRWLLIHRKHTLETNVTVHAHTPMDVLKVKPTKHTPQITVWLTEQEVGKAHSI